MLELRNLQNATKIYNYYLDSDPTYIREHLDYCIKDVINLSNLSRICILEYADTLELYCNLIAYFSEIDNSSLLVKLIILCANKVINFKFNRLNTKIYQAGICYYSFLSILKRLKQIKALS